MSGRVENKTMQHEFWSDASFGDDQQISSAVLCRLAGEGQQQRPLIKVLAYLGEGTSIEAELLGGVLGCVLMRACRATSTEVMWYSDCRPVVEQALSGQGSGSCWDAWKVAQQGIHCVPQYLEPAKRGREHRACDRASRWARTKGLKLLDEFGQGPLGRLAQRDARHAWHLFDARALMAAIRSAQVDTAVARLEHDLAALISSALTSQEG